MLSLDEPLDLKLPSGRTHGPVRLGKRACPSSICAPLSGTRPRLLCTTFPSPPSSPDSQSPSLERPGSCFTPPAMDLSLSPSSRHASSLSPSPSSPSSPSPSSLLESPHSSRSPQPHVFSRGFPFYLPIGSPPRGYSFPSSMFIGQNREKQVSPEPSLDGQLACRWRKCHLLFDSLQDLVDHINDFHVKPEKDSGYCCQWEGCARNGRGFNARCALRRRPQCQHTLLNRNVNCAPSKYWRDVRSDSDRGEQWPREREKPYVCPYEGCSKRYSNSSDRFKHTRTHYVDKPYYCKMAGCLKRYTDPSSLRKHIKAHGHFVAPEQGAPRSGLGSGLGLPGHQSAAELPSVGGAHIIIPGAAAALLGGLGASLPLSAYCHARALGHHGAPLFSVGGGSGVGPLGLSDSRLLHFGLSAASMLGLGALGGLGRMVAKEMVGEEQEEDGEVLNLSAGVGPRRSDAFSWVVVPPRALLLKPAAVS
ncbi:putative zinc finger protein GLIS2-like [Scophthalmus maximus]|uniref:Putative zinc finger protein GLIS2-like n=1 Tax=Scophthalmus maximus TaxID=52904 RepID=A0A2U9BNR0_SCOMX|nr:putative zinc finger protein GLIS2-like [Scophthalmus maximus]